MDENITKLHEKFSEYGKHAKQWTRKCALLLPEIKKFEVWKAKGFSCIYEYAAKLAGMSRSQVDDALYILEKIEDKPALLQVVEKKGLNAVRPVVSIATVENEKFLAGKAMEMSNGTLRAFVRGVGRETLAVHGSQQVRDIPKKQIEIKNITMQLSEKLAGRLGKFKNGRGWEETVVELLDLAEKYQVEATEKPEAVKTDSRHIPKQIKDYVLKRAGGECEFPDCHKRVEQLHHINRFASDKTHDPDKIVALCEAHHNLAHLGLIGSEESGTADWKIREERDLASLNCYIDQQYELYRR